MFYDDHNPPHFHAFYGSDEAWVTINTLAVFHGNLPSRASGMVIEWASLHQDELRRNWALMGEEAKPKKIAPLR